eukprot:scaffold79210_cov28-Tisochrysis_lutea.AAC.3
MLPCDESPTVGVGTELIACDAAVLGVVSPSKFAGSSLWRGAKGLLLWERPPSALLLFSTCECRRGPSTLLLRRSLPPHPSPSPPPLCGPKSNNPGNALRLVQTDSEPAHTSSGLAAKPPSRRPPLITLASFAAIRAFTRPHRRCASASASISRASAAAADSARVRSHRDLASPKAKPIVPRSPDADATWPASTLTRSVIFSPSPITFTKRFSSFGSSDRSHSIKSNRTPAGSPPLFAHSITSCAPRAARSLLSSRWVSGSNFAHRTATRGGARGYGHGALRPPIPASKPSPPSHVESALRELPASTLVALPRLRPAAVTTSSSSVSRLTPAVLPPQLDMRGKPSVETPARRAAAPPTSASACARVQ